MSGGKLTREEFKKQKQLEEARKAGTAPPQLDEDGKEINPHIPQYIANAPWYLDTSKPSLKHQRAFQDKEYDRSWYEKGPKGPAATKYRKGACANCGALTHQAKDCCDRPRKLGARWSGKDIKPDEHVQQLKLDYDGKRDRWNGYDPANHLKLVEEHAKLEQERRKIKKQKELEKFMTEPDPNHQRYPHTQTKETETKKFEKLVDDSDSEDSSFSDDDKNDFLDPQQEAQVTVKKDPKTRTTIRNLRIREDTAKYLRNLDPNSAYYDPKSRSMRENPYPDKRPDEVEFAGENFVRASGDVNKFYQMQGFAFTAYEKGNDIHLQAAPSQAELEYQHHKQKHEMNTEATKEAIFAKYGGQEHLDSLPKELIYAQTEDYVEYTRDGRILRGADKAVPKSKYPEDVYINNHKSVWGSYWEDGKWGFACCHQTVKNSYCTGEAGKLAKKQMREELQPVQPEPIQFKSKEKKKFKEEDEKKRHYHSLNGDYEVSPEEYQEYLLKKQRFEDPMKDYVKA